MKVVIAHNRYRSNAPSGENSIVDSEIAALASAGIDVIPFLRSSDEIDDFGLADKALTAAGPITNRDSVAELNRIIDTERPDVLHVHNVYPLLSPSIIKAAHDRGVAVVHTVHNFRLDCVAGSYLRDGHVCTECSGHRVATPALKHGCYRGSRAQSVPMVISRTVHRPTWQLVDRFLALTSFHADFLSSLGVPADRIVIRPTSAADPGPPSAPGRNVLFVGRLGNEKGVTLLVDAWKQSTAGAQGRRLRIAGDGELLTAITSAARSDASIDVLGPLDRRAVAEEMRAAGIVAIPSLWFEGFPLVLAEACAHGRAVIVSNQGGLGAIVDDTHGITLPPGSVEMWARALSALDDSELTRLGAGARAFYTRHLMPQTTLATLIATYESAIQAGRSGLVR